MEKFQLITKINEKHSLFRHCTESQVTYNLKHCTLPVLHCEYVRSIYHSEHLGQSLDQASDVCRRSNMLRKLTCIAGSSYSSAALNEIIP